MIQLQEGSSGLYTYVNVREREAARQMMDFLSTFVLLISFAVARGCGDPPVISNSDNDLTGTAPYDEGTSVTYTCSDGYTVSGPAKVYCMADGTWGWRPECVASQCPDYPGLNYTKCLETSLVRSDVIYMYCDADVNKVTKVGSGTSALCMDSQWKDTSLACYCNCECKSNDANLVFYNCNANGYILHDNPLSWGCKAGSHKKSGASVTCFDGDFSMEPECEPDATNPPPANTSSPATTSSPIPLEVLIPIIGVVFMCIVCCIWCCINFFYSIWLKKYQVEIKETLSCTSKMRLCLAGGVCKSYAHDRHEIGVKCHVYCFNCCSGGNEDVHDPSNQPLRVEHADVEMAPINA